MNTSPRILEQTSAACTWALPQDASGARRARRLLVATLTSFGALPEIIGDAELMVSELATNAFRHAPQHGPHELWLDLTDPRGFVCAVFDTMPLAALASNPVTSGDFGRGLSIVTELSQSRWGIRVARSRLRPAVSGKAVWFAGDLPYDQDDAAAAAMAGSLLTSC